MGTHGTSCILIAQRRSSPRIGCVSLRRLWDQTRECRAARDAGRQVPFATIVLTIESMSAELNHLPLPSAILHAISSPGGGRVVLVLGAGCSVEEPTGLPMSGSLSEDCHRRLWTDGVLDGSEVSAPRDLSAVADAVFLKTGSQRDLVDRFPLGDFSGARPNEGYQIMVALLLEGALTDAMTLNFDLAAAHAVSELGGGPRISIVRGPEFHNQMSDRNLFYLHRDVNSEPDELILRTEALDDAWRNQWEQVVAQRVLASPTVVFVGLGSPAAVLVETTRRIAEATGASGGNIFVVDPSDLLDSRFAQAINVPVNNYIRMSWGEFMRALSERLVTEHQTEILNDCANLVTQNGLDNEDVTDICARLVALGILALGKIRAAWMLDNSPYQPHTGDVNLHNICNLILGIAMIERLSKRQAHFTADGLVEFVSQGYPTTAMVCSGGGWMGAAKIRAELSQRRANLKRQGRRPSVAIVAGVEAWPEFATPDNIAVDEEPNSLITGSDNLKIVALSNLRSDSSLVDEVFT